jgi:DeoR family transcriptional regulator, fructose operon transcriptional repressor
MGSGSIANNRHVLILEFLHKSGIASVEVLSDKLNVSKVTIRRDLDSLNEKGLLIRTHGGACVSQDQEVLLKEREFTKKDVIHVNEKQRIALKTLELIEENEILFMNSGSTTLFFLRALTGLRVKVITNNAAAIETKLDPLVELMILGGEYRHQSRSFVGEFALNTLRDIYSNHTLLGTNGLSLERGLTTTVYQECSINQTMIENTHGKVIVLADHTKMGRISNFVSAPLKSVDIVITDDKCPDSFVSGLESQGIQVIIA